MTLYTREKTVRVLRQLYKPDIATAVHEMPRSPRVPLVSSGRSSDISVRIASLALRGRISSMPFA